MNTALIDTQQNNDTVWLAEAAGILRSGGLVAFPTETVYGLGGNALDPEAAKKIYAAKGRPSDNPLILHIADMEALSGIAKEIPPMAEKLADAFWPGPMTMVFEKRPEVPDATTGGLPTAAVRMPAHPTALALIRAAGLPIAAPSANLSGRPSPTTAAHVWEDLHDRIPMILDGGPCGIGLESTVVDVTGEVPVILRPGYVTREMIAEVCGACSVDPAVEHPTEGMRPKAPGMKYRHYAPKAPLTLVEGEAKAAAEKIASLAAEAAGKGLRVGILGTEETAALYRELLPEAVKDRIRVQVIGSRKDPSSVARNLFAVLRAFDETGEEELFGETFPTDHLGFAVMNRLEKAAGHKKIQA